MDKEDELENLNEISDILHQVQLRGIHSDFKKPFGFPIADDLFPRNIKNPKSRSSILQRIADDLFPRNIKNPKSRSDILQRIADESKQAINIIGNYLEVSDWDRFDEYEKKIRNDIHKIHKNIATSVEAVLNPAPILKKLKEIEKEEGQDNEKSVNQKNPYTDIKNGKGYFIISGEHIEIGGRNSRKFKLVESLCCPFGAKMSKDLIFGKVCTEAKQIEVDELSNSSPYEAAKKQKELIRGQWREVKRLIKEHLNKLSGKKGRPKLDCKFKFDKTSVWLE